MSGAERWVRTLGQEPCTVLVLGAGGGIGGQFVRELSRFEQIHLILTARNPPADDLSTACSGRHTWFAVDFEAAEGLDKLEDALNTPHQFPPLVAVIVATGFLHSRSMRPEKHSRELTREQLEKSFLLNAIGPTLALSRLLPLFPRGRRGYGAVLSARVGSISDNRLGGWYGYRASKAALNQLIRTLAIEWRRRHGELVLVGLHPGTVDTALSAPFQRSVPDGKLFSPEFSVDRLFHVMAERVPADSGNLFAWDGTPIPF